ncbi:DUF5777 family beta-barrel protein [Flammeovirga sp. SJP92]|uniref:DUF5777 family beta-barrel protein n=1 Tax=Flammeovirga sp. SJP92 TaxID=1775430 RepID=UPI000787C4EE|nr:DUF5777 family beta-barrel protein [Flammeovirga sp. SJP92]KXX71921.1 hypothetical protein AVL50_03810 [Flammeovirga sp. SJP92]
MKTIYLFSIFLLISLTSYTQDDLLDVLEQETDTTPTYVYATFKGSRLINGHTLETRGQNELEFLISHRFGPVSDGSYELFGLDQANIRLGLSYGINDRLTVGLGRSSFEKTYDGYLKYRLLRQASSGKSTPISITLFGSATYITLRDPIYETASNRMTYTTQALIARKFSSSFSLQLMPTYIHFNLTTTTQLDQDLFALGIGGRLKLTRRLSINAEYYPRLNATSTVYYDAFAVGFDIETGGHVFQFHVTNSRPMIEKGFIAETTEDFFSGDIRLGFNISRSFVLGKKKKKQWD